MEFKPGKPSKPARAVKLPELKAKIRSAKPTSAKTVGGGTVLVYFDDVNFYLSDGRALREVLAKFSIEP
jgi:hypothetical protein